MSTVPTPGPSSRHDQPNLFDPDRDDLDQPVPFQVTARGRMLVDPATPSLRVVPTTTGGGPAGGAERIDDVRVSAELMDVDGPSHARVRALRRSGATTMSITRDLGLDPTTVAVMSATDPVVAARPGRPAAPDVLEAHQAHDAPAERETPRGQRCLALLAAVGEVEAGGIVATTNRIAVATELVRWLRVDRQVHAGAIRVVLRVAETSTADLVARAWADRLDLGRDRVSTVDWRGAPGPRSVQAILRATGRGLADHVGARLARWPAGPADGAP